MMIKPLVKYLLSLCILLLGGYSQLSAFCPNKTSNCYYTIKNLKSSGRISLDALQNIDALFIKPTSFGTEKQTEKSNESLFEIEEDDESFAFKRHVKGFIYSTSFVFSLTQGNFFSNNKGILPFYKYSSYRYLIFQAFRI